MILGRHDRYLGHLPYRLPTLYVCAECGGEIRCCCTGDGGYEVTCRTDERHDGLKSRAQVELERSLQAMAFSALREMQLDEIAKYLPEANKYMQAQREELKKVLFGED